MNKKILDNDPVEAAAEAFDDDLLKAAAKVGDEAQKRWREQQQSASRDRGSDQRQFEPESITDLLKVEFDPLKMAMEEYLPEGLCLFAGPPKKGKSILALGIAVATAMEGKYLDKSCLGGDVLCLLLEDSRRRVKARVSKVLDRMGFDPQRCRYTFEYTTEWSAIDAGGIDKLRNWIQKHENTRLIIVDVLHKIRPTKRQRDESPYALDYRSLEQLQMLARDYRITIIVIHHTRKASADDIFEMVSGTNALTAAADTVWVLKWHSFGSHAGWLFSMEGRDIEGQELVLERDDYLWKVLGPMEEVKISSEARKVVEAMMQLILPATIEDILMAAGYEKRRKHSLETLLSKMVARHEIVRVNRGRYDLPRSARRDDLPF